MKRRILSSLMALVLVFGLLPVTVFAAEGESTTPADPFEGAKTIYVSDKGTGDGTAEDKPTTLPKAVAKINGYTPVPGDAAPAFIISLTEDLKFTCASGALTLQKYATRILGNGHSIETNQAISAIGKGTRVDLGKPDGTDTLTVNVIVYEPTLSIGSSAKMHMYDGVTVKHETEETNLSDAAIKLSAEGNFYMHGGQITNCTTLKATILVDGGSHVEIHGGTVRDNIIMETHFGGAICLFNKSSLVVDGNVLFKNNKTHNRGGAIYLADNSTANISGKTVFENNKAGSIGGAIYVQYSSLTVDGATFEGNSASLGGAILALGGSGPDKKATVQLKDCTFTGNSTTGGGAGGALYLQDTEMTLTDCTIENNTAGGGVFVTASDENLSKLTLNRTNLIQNNTITDGAPCNLYLEVAGDSDTSNNQLTLNVGDAFGRSQIGVTMHTVERGTPEESVPFTVGYQKNCGTTHPSSYFFSDNPGYRVDWSEDGSEARLLKGKAEYKVELDPTSLDFGSKVVDYATAPEAKTVTVTNKGNMPVTVTLPTVDGYKFVWEDSGDNEPKTLPAEGSAVFTVQPKTGLPAGSYDKTAKLTVDNGIAPVLSVSFSVTTPSSGDDDDKYFFAIQKVDAQDGHALNGATFKLYQYDSKGKPVNRTTAKTSRNGSESGIALFSVSATQTRDGGSTWYYREITAPEGYVLDTKEYEISARDFYHDDQSKAVAKAKTVRNYRGTTPDLLNDSDHFAYVIGYKDGNVRPYGLISRAETTTIFFRLLKDSVRDGNLLTGNTYTDVADDYWANTAISTMTGLGIVQGRSADTFDPKAPITRAQFAAICARFDTGKSNGEQTFSDIQGHWAEKYIERAAELGWIKGFEDGTFRPDTYITRAQAMTMINRVLNRIPEEESDLLPGMNVWPDCNPGDWFYLAVQEATNSHDFEHKAGNYETWTGMNKDPDWTRYEH